MAKTTTKTKSKAELTEEQKDDQAQAELERLMKMPFNAEGLMAGKDLHFKHKTTGEPIKLNLKIVKMIASDKREAKITDVEALVFMRLCKQYGLDPLMQEIYLIKYDNKRPAQNVIAAQSYLRIADSFDDYQGYEKGWIVSKAGKGRRLVPQGEGFGNDENITGAWCQAFRKGRHTEVYEVEIAEFTKGQSTWNSMPKAMVAKCARGGAHRVAFPNLFGGGVITEDEANVSISMNDYSTVDQSRVAKREEQTGGPEDVQTVDTMLAELLLAFTESVRAVDKDITDAEKIDDLFDSYATYVLGVNAEGLWQDGFLTIQKVERLGEFLTDNGLPQAIVEMIKPPEDFNQDDEGGALFEEKDKE